MIICNMTEEDLAQVAAIETQSFSMPWSEDGFRQGLSQEGSIFLLAKEENKVLGYIGMYRSFEEGEITNVAVAPESRGAGVASALVAELLTRCRHQGVTRVVLEVRVSNASAIYVYEKAGFLRIGTRKGFYDFPKEDADIMVWEYEK